MNQKLLLKETTKITKNIKEILPPKTLLEECRCLSEKSNRLAHSVISFSQENHPIDLFTFGKERPTVLFYGFPDPGEAVGGTGILALMEALASGKSLFNSWKLKWLFIPCINFDDQPDSGLALTLVMRNKRKREVDWCLSNPRPETKALVKVAREHRPIFSFPLHDEYHSGKEILPYVGVSKKLNPKNCQQVRACFKHYKTSLNPSIKDAKMGKGFLEMTSAGQEYQNSTFSVLDNYGTVVICEVSKLDNLQAHQLVSLQLSVGMTVLGNILKKAASHRGRLP